MTEPGREPLIRAETRMRPLTNSNGTVTLFVADSVKEGLSGGTAPLTLRTRSKVNVAKPIFGSVVHAAIPGTIRNKLTRVTQGMFQRKSKSLTERSIQE